MTTHQNYKNVQTMNLKLRPFGDKDTSRDKFMWWKNGKWVYHVVNKGFIHVVNDHIHEPNNLLNRNE